MAFRLTAAELCLVLAVGCGTPRVVRLDTGLGAPLEYRPPSTHTSVTVDEDAFEEALARWVLNAPLPLRSFSLKTAPPSKGVTPRGTPRFVTRAADKASHNGYQQWHRAIDDEVIQWLKDHQLATPEEFEAYLRQLYSSPEMRARFPHGF